MLFLFARLIPSSTTTSFFLMHLKFGCRSILILNGGSIVSGKFNIVALAIYMSVYNNRGIRCLMELGSESLPYRRLRTYAGDLVRFFDS